MTELTQETENLDRAMILEAVEFEVVKQGRSLVVVIGINEYVHWQKLKNAVQDAIGLQQTLIDKLGFVAPIPPLLNEAATKEAIESLIEDRLHKELQEDDNLVLFFAGHGHTRIDKVGGKVVGETGFIVPVKARVTQEYWSDYIRIDPLLQSISRLPARHILVILDSCHSGFALGEAMKSFRGNAVFYEKDLSSRISRKVITSAHREQSALDGGPLSGHSLFTGILINAFNSENANSDDNRFITSSELGLFVQQQVAQASESHQTPDFGSFYLDDRGEMVMLLRTQSFDALKNRAFSALQKGEFTTLKELVREIVNLKPSSPEALYLQYRLMIVEGDFLTAILLINQLLEIDLERAFIPLSKHDLRATLSQIQENFNLLELQEESNFPLKIELLTGSDKGTLAKVKEDRIDKNNIYSVESQNFGQLKIENLSELTLYVYAIKIDSDGRVTAGRLWENEGVLLNGLQPQKTELSYTFVFNDRLGVCERYLLSSRIIISHLSVPQFSPNVALPETNGDNLDLINLKNLVVKQVIRYQILPPKF
jgi:Caspase domain